MELEILKVLDVTNQNRVQRAVKEARSNSFDMAEQLSARSARMIEYFVQ